MFQISKSCFVFQPLNETFGNAIFVSRLTRKDSYEYVLNFAYCLVQDKTWSLEIYENKKHETWRVVTIEIISSALASLWKFQ